MKTFTIHQLFRVSAFFVLSLALVVWPGYVFSEGSSATSQLTINTPTPAPSPCVALNIYK